jgi:biopolymer transport protein ExbB/TolQ
MFTALPLASGGIIFAFENSNFPEKIIILILVLGSVFSWSVIWNKIAYIRAVGQATRLFLRRFRAARTPLELYEQKAQFYPSAMAAVYQAGARELCFHMLGSAEVDETFKARLQGSPKVSPVAMNAVRSAMERTVGEEMLKLESQMILLATCVSGAPFLGLLGTVWGVMDAFSAVAQAGAASMATLAPGVSGALITTVTGLLVAIPAMFGYNFLITTVKQMTVEMENFAAECAASFEHRYLRAE